MTTTPDTKPFKGEIRITLDAPNLADATDMADRIFHSTDAWLHLSSRLHGIYLVDEDGREIEGV